MRSIVLCADDFAMSDGITSAVKTLAAEGRLSATSAIVTGPLWRDTRVDARELHATLAVGLHLSLTWGRPLGPMPTFSPRGRFPHIRTVVAKSLLGQIPAEEVSAEFERQLCAFQDVTGFPPDFVDGHEHVHALPGIRGALFSALARTDPKRTWIIRTPSDHVGAIVRRRKAVTKALLVAGLCQGFRFACGQRGYDTNDTFAGFSRFAIRSNAEKTLANAISAAGERHMIMCHPAAPGFPALHDDTIANARFAEYAALRAADWLVPRLWRKPNPGAPLWS